jgi:hypothetical protein
MCTCAYVCVYVCACVFCTCAAHVHLVDLVCCGARVLDNADEVEDAARPLARSLHAVCIGDVAKGQLDPRLHSAGGVHGRQNMMACVRVTRTPQTRPRGRYSARPAGGDGEDRLLCMSYAALKRGVRVAHQDARPVACRAHPTQYRPRIHTRATVRARRARASRPPARPSAGTRGASA